jgi:hypothetical protein
MPGRHVPDLDSLCDDKPCGYHTESDTLSYQPAKYAPVRTLNSSLLRCKTPIDDDVAP